MAKGVYTLGVHFVGKNGVSPALRQITVDSRKTAGKILSVASATKQALGGLPKHRGLGLAGAFGTASILYGVQRGIRGVVTEASRFEVANLQFSKLIGNAELAAETLKELEVFAARTPFEFKQSQEISKGLLAAGVNARKLIPTLRMLGDLGMGDPEKVDHLALAYGKVRMTGKATWRELRMFATAGVPIFEEIRRITGNTQEQLESFVRSGKAKFPLMEKALKNLSGQGGKFEGMMINMMSTVPGLWSNFQDVVDQVSRRLGTAFQPALKMVLMQLTQTADAVRLWVEANQSLLSQQLGGFLMNIAGGIRNVRNSIDQTIGRIAALGKWLKIGLVLFLGWQVGLGILGLIATGFQIASAAALIFSSAAAVALSPILIIIGAIVAGIALVAWGLRKVGLLGGRNAGDLLGTLGEEFRETFGFEMPSSPQSPEGRAAAQRTESVSSTESTQRVRLSLADGINASDEEGSYGSAAAVLGDQIWGMA